MTHEAHKILISFFADILELREEIKDFYEHYP